MLPLDCFHSSDSVLFHKLGLVQIVEFPESSTTCEASSIYFRCSTGNVGQYCRDNDARQIADAKTNRHSLKCLLLLR